jgi:uncharacterized protein (TIGR00661 family)
MRFFFIVQGEGRGHMTQAISLSTILRKNGHDLQHVVVGKSSRREIPDFFHKNIPCPISQLESPNFVTDKKNKSVKLFRSILFNLLRINVFYNSINQLDVLVKEKQPDVIVNFYDFLGGLYFLYKNPKVQHIPIAHQFFIEHPTFEFPRGKLLDRFAFKLGNKLASFRASKKLALSFQDYEDTVNEIVIVPPLIREEIKTIQVTHKDHFLVYMVNHGYAEQVEAFHQKNPTIPIHCFWDKKDEPETLSKSENLTFHRLSDKKFIELMASCKGYLTTAGFESICEAMLMGKPVLMVPVKGHYEQSCNAADATDAGAGIANESFDLEILLNYIPSYTSVQKQFRSWCDRTEELLIKNLTDVS